MLVRRACGPVVGWLVLAAALAGCAAERPRSATTASSPCPETEGSPVERVCRQDRSIRTLQARFRATVVVDGEAQTTDGVLLVRRPDAVRVKMFGLAGMTVHDALWVGDATAVRGLVQRPLTGEPISLELRSGESPEAPEAELSLALWSLWQSRCAMPPTTVAAPPGWLRLEPHGAHAVARDVRVGTLGVDEERLVRATGDGANELVVRYRDRDCSSASLLPTRIEMISRPSGWRATVRILWQEVNVDLDGRLFVFPEDGETVR